MPDVPNFDKAALAWTLPWDADWVTAVAWLGPSRLVAAGNNRGDILLWQLPDRPGAPAPAPIRRLDGHTNAVTRLLATPDGKRLISASYDHAVRVWDPHAPAAGADTVTLNTTAREEAVRRKASKVPEPITARVETVKAEGVFEGHEDWVQGLTLNADGTVLASGDDGGRVIVRDLATGKERRRWQVKGWVYGMGLSPDAGKLLVAERVPLVFDSGRHAGVRLWDTATAQTLLDLGKTFPGQHMAAAAFSADGKTLALGRGGEADGMNGKVSLIDPANGKKLWDTPTGHLNGLTDLAFHPSGGVIASTGRDTVVRLWQASDGKLLKELGKPRGGQFKDWLHALSFSADGRWLAAADMAGQVQVWSLEG
jgi:WD40 repeat protein